MRRILVPLDGSKVDEPALREAKRVAPGGEFFLFHAVPVTHPPVGMDPMNEVELSTKAGEYLSEARQRWEVPGGADLVRSGVPAEEILKAVLELNIDLVAMGTHARSGLGRLVVGSVAQQVVRETQLPVLLAHPKLAPPKRAGLKKIMVPVDGTESSEAVLETVRSIALSAAAEVVLVSVEEHIPDPAPQWAVKSPLTVRTRPEHLLQDVVRQLEERNVPATPVVVEGDPVKGILAEVRRQEPDLLAMATHGRTGLERLFEGSVAERVLHEAGVPVLLQKPLVRKSPKGGSDA